MNDQDSALNCVVGLKNMLCIALLSSVYWWCKMNCLLCAVVCCFVVGKAASGANINVHVIQHIEHAEGEIFASLTRFHILFIWLFCFYAL